MLTDPFTVPAKLVVFLPPTLIKKKGPLVLEVRWHSRHITTSKIEMNAFYEEHPQPLSNCHVSGRFWTFSFVLSTVKKQDISQPCQVHYPFSGGVSGFARFCIWGCFIFVFTEIKGVCQL